MKITIRPHQYDENISASHSIPVLPGAAGFAADILSNKEEEEVYTTLALLFTELAKVGADLAILPDLGDAIKDLGQSLADGEEEGESNQATMDFDGFTLEWQK